VKNIYKIVLLIGIILLSSTACISSKYSNYNNEKRNLMLMDKGEYRVNQHNYKQSNTRKALKRKIKRADKKKARQYKRKRK